MYVLALLVTIAALIVSMVWFQPKKKVIKRTFPTKKWEETLKTVEATDAIWEIGVSPNGVSVSEEGMVRTIHIEAVTTDLIYNVILKAIVEPDYDDDLKPLKPNVAVFLPTCTCTKYDISETTAKFKDHGIRIATQEEIAPQLTELRSKRLKETLIPKITPDPSVVLDPQPLRGCISCRKEIDGKASQCSACKAVIYCSADCAKKDWANHKNLCANFKAQIAHIEEWKLTEFPFKFNVSSYNQTSFLNQRGLHNIGIYKRLCGCYNGTPFGQLSSEVFSVFNDPKDLFAAMALPEEMFPLSKPVKQGVDPLKIASWKDLYAAKEWSLDNPACLVLDVPMTIYYFITKYIPKTQKTITLHLVGVEREADLLPLFEILLGFFKDTSICIHMIGPAISSNIPPERRAVAMKSVNQNSTLFMTLSTCFYGPEHADGSAFKLPDNVPEEIKNSQNFGEGKPDLVICLNPNLLGHQEWVPFLQGMYNSGQKVVMTESMEQMVNAVEANLPMIKASLSLKATPNPFRHPAFHFKKDVNLPGWSNGFYFGMGPLK